MTHALTVETIIKCHIVVTRARGTWHSFFSLYLLFFVVVIKYVSYKFIVLIILSMMLSVTQHIHDWVAPEYSVI